MVGPPTTYSDPEAAHLVRIRNSSEAHRNWELRETFARENGTAVRDGTDRPLYRLGLPAHFSAQQRHTRPPKVLMLTARALSRKQSRDQPRRKCHWPLRKLRKGSHPSGMSCKKRSTSRDSAATNRSAVSALADASTRPSGGHFQSGAVKSISPPL